jgi:hypothetical protein
MMKNRIALGVLASILSLTLFQQPAFATGKIVSTPGSLTLTPGQSSQLSFALTQPIICPTDPAQPTCNVVLNFSASQSQGVTVSPTILTWDSTEWFQPRLMTVTLSAQTPATQSQDIVLSATAVSRAAFYDAVVETVTVSLDIPPAPSPSPSVTPIPSENNALVRTGSNTVPALLIGTGALVTGFGVVAYRRVSKRSL